MAKKRHRLSKTDKDVANIVAMYVRNEMEDFHVQHLTDAQMKELNPIIRNAIAAALYAIRNYGKDEACRKLVNFQDLLIPEYWEEPKLTEEFRQFVKYLEKEKAEEAKKAGSPKSHTD